MDVNSKIEQFSRVIFKEAEEEKEQIRKQMSEKYKNAITDLKAKAIKDSETQIEQKKQMLEREYNKQVLQLNNDMRKRLIHRRDELVAQIFKTVEEQLNDFVKSAGYADWLINTIQQAKSLFASNDIKAVITPNDMRLAEAIQSKTGVRVEESALNFIGGCRLICESRKLAMDKTILTALNEQKTTFNKLKIS